MVISVEGETMMSSGVRWVIQAPL